jgi:hypothetical protein
MNGEGSVGRNDIKAENMHFQNEGKQKNSQDLRVFVARAGVFTCAKVFVCESAGVCAFAGVCVFASANWSGRSGFCG